jgi:biopolymer transport protein TolQ
MVESVAQPEAVAPGAGGVIDLAAIPDLSVIGLFLQADVVVKTVMVLLLLSSIVCWAVVLEKALQMRRLRREALALEREVAATGALQPERFSGLAQAIVAAGVGEWRDPDAGESHAERRTRIEDAMRLVMREGLRRHEPGLPYLATLGATAPFVGLFGTVWGIMNSFTAIAGAQDTSLAVVAPGIAEALFATAMGLLAAIPAVIAYNRFASEFARLGQRLGTTIGRASARLARMPPPLPQVAE